MGNCNGYISNFILKRRLLYYVSELDHWGVIVETPLKTLDEYRYACIQLYRYQQLVESTIIILSDQLE